MKRGIVLLLLLASIVRAGSIVISGPNAVPEGNDFIDVACGQYHNLALRESGELLAWGWNQWGQCDVPEANYIDMDGGSVFTIAVKEDRSLAVWGVFHYELPTATNFIAVSACAQNCLGLTCEGEVFVWGPNTYGEQNVPDGLTAAAIAAGDNHGLAIRADGSLCAWGRNDSNECNVPGGTDYIAIAAARHSLALKSNGTVLAWGSNLNGECDVPDYNDFIAIAAGYDYSVGIRAGGSAITWGNAPTIPDSESFVTVAAGETEVLFLTTDRSATLRIISDPEGMVNVRPATGTHTHYYGQRVLLNAARSPVCPDVYDFNYWSGDIPDPCSASQYIVMDSNKAVTAHYVADEKRCGDECHPIHEPYDTNRDCRVDFIDFALMAEVWGCTHPDCD